MKVGVFGGSFNPPHLGHLLSLQSLQKKLGLQKIHIVPAASNPLKTEVEGPTPEQRLEMVRLAVSGWGEQFLVDDQEVKRGGASYTIDTLHKIQKDESKDLFLIVGADQLESFGKWKKFVEILEIANLVVISRPGYEFPESVDAMPAELRSMVAEFDFNYVELKTGKSIQFVHLPEVDISSTELRKWIRTGKNVEKHLPLAVENFIKQNGIYKRAGQKITDYQKFTRFCGDRLFAKKAIAVRGFDLRKMSAPSEFAIVTSGTSTKHTASLGENLAREVKEEFGLLPLSIEGVDEGRWVVVDYGSLIIHIFYDFVRQEYSLENLWNGAIDMDLKDSSLTQ